MTVSGRFKTEGEPFLYAKPLRNGTVDPPSVPAQPALKGLYIFAFLSCRLPSTCPGSASSVSMQTLTLFSLAQIFPFFHLTMSATDQEGQLDTPPSDRSAWRDTAIDASDNRDKVLRGHCATEGITNSNLYSIIKMFCFFTDTFTLHNNSGQLVERDEQKLQPGNYYIATNGNSFPHSLVSKFLVPGLVPQRKKAITYSSFLPTSPP